MFDVSVSCSLTAAETLANLRTLREQLMHLISHLQQELDSQKQTIDQLRKDKVKFILYILHGAFCLHIKCTHEYRFKSFQERELSIQRQQLRTERDQALDSLKERLIQV